MKIEIESAEDYTRGRAFLAWLIAARLDGILPPKTEHIGAELAHALDDYRQIHYPLGGEPT